MFVKQISSLLVLIIILVFVPSICAAQEPAGQSPSLTVQVPRLIAVSGTLKDQMGRPLSGVTGLKLAMYKDQEGGAPIWIEIQNASLDEQGRYSVMLGAAVGLPLDLFASSDARWLGVQAVLPGEQEQARLLFVSVPYALKSVDADTLGGKPASAYKLLSDTANGTTQETTVSSAKTGEAPVVSQVNSGTAGYLGMFVNTVDLGNSNLFQSGTNVGIGTTAPSEALSLSTGSANPKIQLGSSPGTVIGLGGNYLGTGSGTDGNMILRNDAGNILFGFLGSEKVRMQSDGKVGIGTTAPSELLSLTTGAANNPKIQFGTSPGTAIGLGGNYLGSGSATDGNMILRNDSGNILFGFGGIERVRMQSDGNVGIGTTNATAKLDVSGTVKATALVGNGAGLTGLPAATDVSCSSTCIATSEIADSAVTTLKIADGTIVDADISVGAAISASKLSDPARTRGITYLGGCDTCSTLTPADDQQTIYFNVVGSMTVQSVTCFANAGVVTINILRDNGGGPASSVLSGPLTCNGTATTSFLIPTLALNDKLDFDLATTDNTAKRVTVAIKTIVN